MNWKKFILTFVVVFVVTFLGNFLIHGMLLHAPYAQHPQLLRPQQEANRYLGFMAAAFLFFSLGFVWIYAHGVEEKPWVGQGLRFGLAVWLLVSVTRYLIYYAIQPWPGGLVAQQIGYELVLTLILGLLAAALYRK